MKILVNTLELAPATGIDLHALQMSRELARRGHTIHVIAQRDGGLRGDWEDFAEEVVVAGDFLHQPLSPTQLRDPRKFSSWLGALRRAVAAGRRVKPDVIYANDAQSLIWARTTSGAQDVPIVCHLHSHLGERLGRQRRFLARGVFQFIAPSEFIRREWVRGGLRDDQIKVVYQAVDAAHFVPPTPKNRADIRDRLQIPAEAFVVIYLGRIVPDKGVEVLVNAWRDLGLSSAQGRLLIVGSAYPRNYVEGLYDLAPPTTLFIRPQVDVLPMLHAADVLVIPSKVEEACPRVVIEAMASGLPAVGTRAGGIPEILAGDFDSMMFERGDTAGLVSILAALRHWRTEDPQLGTKCREYVQENFSLDVAADMIEQTLLDASTEITSN